MDVKLIFSADQQVIFRQAAETGGKHRKLHFTDYGTPFAVNKIKRPPERTQDLHKAVGLFGKIKKRRR